MCNAGRRTFSKILTELLVNALRFSKPGRPVGITGKPSGP